MFLKAVLTFIIVIFMCCANIGLVFGAIPQSNERDQKSNLVGLLCELQKLDMFGMPKPTSEIEIKNTFDVNQLKLHIRTVYDTLRCSYIFGAQIYMHSVGTLLVYKRRTPLLTDVEGITFTDEASRMLATMFNVDEIGNTGTRNVIFIFYMYTERLRKYFTLTITGKNSQDSKIISKVHRSVNRFMDCLLKSNECTAFNQKNHLDEHLGCDMRPLENRLRVITYEKFLVAGQLTRNATHTIDDKGSEQSSLKVLALNEVVLNTHVMDKFFHSFPVHVDWNPLMVLLKLQLENATRISGIFLSQQIRSLSLYQDLFVQMMKVVVIRLTLKYATYLNTLKFFDRIKYGLQHNDKVLDFITKFEEYFQLRDDNDMNSLKKVFKKWIPMFAVQNNVQSIQHVLTGISLKVIKKDGLASPMDISEDLKSPNVSISVLIEDSVRILSRFVEHVKEMLPGINFIVIQSFIRIPTTKEFESLLYFESN